MGDSDLRAIPRVLPKRSVRAPAPLVGRSSLRGYSLITGDRRSNGHIPAAPFSGRESKHCATYPANRHARAALTCSECGACRDWTG